MLDQSPRDAHDFVADVSEYCRVVEEKLASHRSQQMWLYKMLGALICVAFVEVYIGCCMPRLHVSWTASDLVVAPITAHFFAIILEWTPVFYAIVLLMILLMALREARLNLTDGDDRGLIEKFLLPHRTKLASHPDAQFVFAAYDAKKSIPCRSAQLRGPTVLTSNY